MTTPVNTTQEMLPVKQDTMELTSAPAPFETMALLMDVQQFGHIQRVAQMFSQSTMVPEHFRNNVGNCAIALNLAQSMEVDPFMLMQNMYIVHGKPGIQSKLVIAMLNKSGRFTPLQFKLEGEDMNRKCTAYATHKETGEVCSQSVSMQLAKSEGWMEPKTGKTKTVQSKWVTMPDIMLQYRAAMFFARIYHPEALLGMQSKEELMDADVVADLKPNNDGSYEADWNSESKDQSGSKADNLASKLSQKVKKEPKEESITPWKQELARCESIDSELFKKAKKEVGLPVTKPIEDENTAINVMTIFNRLVDMGNV